MSGFPFPAQSARMLLELMLLRRPGAEQKLHLSDTADEETAYFPESHLLVAGNNADQPRAARLAEGPTVTLEAMETRFIPL